MRNSRAAEVISWVEKFCCVDGRDKPIYLTQAERATIQRIYDDGTAEPVIGRLAACLALLHVCGPEYDSEPPPLETDLFTVWRMAGPRLRWFIRRDGETIVCSELNTRYPRAA